MSEDSQKLMPLNFYIIQARSIVECILCDLKRLRSGKKPVGLIVDNIGGIRVILSPKSAEGAAILALREMRQLAIEQAHDFLNRLSPKLPPHFSVADDGEVCFYWAHKGFLFDLGFVGDGNYSYYAKLPDGRELFEDGAPIDEPLPIELIELVEGVKPIRS